MTIREILERDRPDWVRLRESLWPGSLSDHDVETRRYFQDRSETPIVLVAETDGRVVGFLELDFRKYAPGCRSSPVAFIEGWHIEAAFQRRGIGRALVEAAEARARAMGHVEIASDLYRCRPRHRCARVRSVGAKSRREVLTIGSEESIRRYATKADGTHIGAEALAEGMARMAEHAREAGPSSPEAQALSPSACASSSG